MSSLDQPASSREDPGLFESDFPSLACHAAIELDNLIRHRSIELTALGKLATLLARPRPAAEPMDLSLLFDPNLDPSDAVTMNWAIKDSKLADPEPRTIDDLVREASRIGSVLESIAQSPQEAREHRSSELATMRAFCVALSKRAAAQHRSVQDWEPPHPFRR